MVKLYIGLGNPDAQYQKTRHNAGFVVVDALRTKLGMPDFKLQKKFQALISKSADIVLVKPQTYMNNSGQAVRAVLDYYNISPNELAEIGTHELFIVYDDLDIVLGEYKVQFAKGPKVHNGVVSVEQHVSSQKFWHVRVGVDGRMGNRRMSGKDYVLQPFTNEELPIFQKTVQTIVKQLEEKE